MQPHNFPGPLDEVHGQPTPALRPGVSVRLVRTARTNLKPLWECPQESDFEGEADESGHAAMRDSGGEVDHHSVLLVLHLYVSLLHYIQLLQGQRVLWIIDDPYQI